MLREASPGGATEDLGCALLDALPDDAILRLDAMGRVITANTAVLALLGYGPNDLAGQSIGILFSATDHERGQPDQILQQALITGAFRGLVTVKRQDGSPAVVELGAYPLRDAAGLHAGYAWTCRDASPLIEAQAAARRFRLLIDCLPDHAICLLDTEGRITDWNEGAERLLGYPADDIVGDGIARFYTAEDQAAGEPETALEAAARDGRHEAEGWRVRRDGGRFWASGLVTALRDEAGGLVGFANIVRDITERRVAHDALRESERQFRLLVNGVSDHAIYMLDPNGVVVSWNAGAQRIKGYSADEVIGQHFSKFYTESDRGAALPLRSLSGAIEKGRYASEGWRVRKDGSLFWASVVIHAVHDENGQLAGFAKITRDTTESREAQLELHRTEQRLFHAQKLEALGQLTGGVAHDFNNLLMVVSGQAEIVKRESAANARVQRAAKLIEAAAGRGAALTRQLLSFARRQHLTRTSVSLPERLANFMEILTNSLTGNIELSVRLPEDLWPIEVDANELELALMNLAVNARDAMPSGGRFTIAAANLTVPVGSDDLESGGEFVAIDISDTGIGIPEDLISKVFDPFFTTKGPNKGTGLGLSQVYGFAKQSGGAARVRSALGQGTTFTLLLPRARAAADAAVAPAPLEFTGEGLALVVEDNAEVAEVTGDLLTRLGYQVRLQPNAEAALQAFEAGEQYRLVVSDVVMAGAMDGLDLARTLRARAPSLPIVLVSGFAEVLVSGSSEFILLPKPFRLEDLQAAIGRATGSAQAAEDAGVVRLADRRP